MKKLVPALVFGLVTLFGSITLTAQEKAGPPSPLPKIIGFINIQGCPRGKFELFIFLENGKIVHMNEDNAPPRTTIVALLAGIEGLNRTFDFGQQI
jgi:hypothetical protein